MSERGEKRARHVGAAAESSVAGQTPARTELLKAAPFVAGQTPARSSSLERSFSGRLQLTPAIKRID